MAEVFAAFLVIYVMVGGTILAISEFRMQARRRRALMDARLEAMARNLESATQHLAVIAATLREVGRHG